MPANEQARLAAVRRYDILDTPPEGAFDRICALAARFFGVPISTITIVDEDRIWFKARKGLRGVTETGRDTSLCGGAILQGGPYVVTDAAVDPRALSNPLVRGELGLRFYAAAPIITRDGHRLGTVNVMDTSPRQVTEGETRTLEELAAIVMDELELRLTAMRTVSYERQQREQAQREQAHAEHVAQTLLRTLLPSRLPAVAGVELASHYHAASREEVGGDFYDVFPIEDGRWGLFVGDVCGKGVRAAALTSLARHALRTAAVVEESPVAVLRDLNATILADERERELHYCTAVFAYLEPAGSAGATLSVASAGHPPMLVLRADGTVEELAVPGLMIGVLRDATFEVATVRLRPGDTALLYTDGITDARPGGKRFGEEGLTDLLRTCAGTTASELVERVRRLLAGFDPPAEDDVALLAVRVPTA